MGHLWHKLAGAKEWIRCAAVRGAKVPRTVALTQLDQCRICPSAQCHDALGCLYLSCGPPGEDHRDDPVRPTCGCLLAWISPRKRKRHWPELLGAARAVILRLMEPVGKTRCRSECPQRRW